MSQISIAQKARDELSHRLKKLDRPHDKTLESRRIYELHESMRVLSMNGTLDFLDEVVTAVRNLGKADPAQAWRSLIGRRRLHPSLGILLRRCDEHAADTMIDALDRIHSRIPSIGFMDDRATMFRAQAISRSLTCGGQQRTCLMNFFNTATGATVTDIDFRNVVFVIGNEVYSEPISRLALRHVENTCYTRPRIEAVIDKGLGRSMSARDITVTLLLCEIAERSGEGSLGPETRKVLNARPALFQEIALAENGRSGISFPGVSSRHEVLEFETRFPTSSERETWLWAQNDRL